MKNIKLIIVLFFILKMDVAIATIKLPALITDGMVLQRDRPLKLWGWGAPGESITIEFNDKLYKTVTNKDKTWNLILPPMKAGGPYQMSIKGSNKILLKDILFGDVWLCSGQSNMEFTMNRAKDTYSKEIAESTNNQIRHFLVKQDPSFYIKDDFKHGEWLPATPENVLRFTAVGYFFALELFKKYHVPIGLIHSSVGGTPVEAWMSQSALEAFPVYNQEAEKFKDDTLVEQIKNRDALIKEEWLDNAKKGDSGSLNNQKGWYDDKLDFSSWDTVAVPGPWPKVESENVSGVAWYKKIIKLDKNLAGKQAELYLGNIEERDTTYVNGIKIGYTSTKYMPRKYVIPSGILKEGDNIITVRILDTEGPGGFLVGKPYQLIIDGQTILLSGTWKYKFGFASKSLPSASFTNFNYKPTVWYNSKIAPLLNYQIKGVIWYQGEANVSRSKEYQSLFPALIIDWRNKFSQGNFPFLFVQLASLGAAESEPSDHDLPRLREAQTMTLGIPNTGMAVTHDIGEWNDIHPQNKKDVGHRLFAVAEKVAYGESGYTNTGPIMESVNIKGDKVIIEFKNTGKGLRTTDGQEIRFFAISGSDKKFIWAKASLLSNNKVVVYNDKIEKPMYVRYAWARNPEGANLENSEGLPAVSFRTDNDQ